MNKDVCHTNHLFCQLRSRVDYFASEIDCESIATCFDVCGVFSYLARFFVPAGVEC